MRFTEAVLNIPSLFLLIIAAKYAGDKIHNFRSLWPRVQRQPDRHYSDHRSYQLDVSGAASCVRISIAQGTRIHHRRAGFGRKGFTNNLSACFAQYHRADHCRRNVGHCHGHSFGGVHQFSRVGCPAPTATWGNMLEDATRYIDSAPQIWIFPGLLILITVLGINFVGDGLRDALDPRTLSE